MSNFDAQFITQFESEMFVAFGNAGSNFRNVCRRRTGITGSEVKFPKIALAGTAQGKTKNGKVPTMDISRDRVTCTLADFYGADWIDSLDELKTNVEQRQPTVKLITESLGRKEDDITTTALVSGTNSADSLGSNDTWTNDTVPRGVLEYFGGADIFAAGKMHARVTWKTWAALVGIDSFVNADYGGDTQMTSDGQRAKMYFGFDYAPFSRLPSHSSGNPLNVWWHHDVLGQAVGAEITSSVKWHDDHDAWFIMGKMSMGAVLIEQLGVVKRRYAP
jgi:hypothetical protein